MTGRFNLEGAEALYATFRELPRATQRNVLMRTLQAVAAPFTARVRAAAPVFIGQLQESVIQGPHRALNKRQKRMERRDAGTFEAAIHIGTADPAGLMKEFGNVNMPADPFFRSEWENSKHDILRDIEQSLGPQIVAAGERAARRNASKG